MNELALAGMRLASLALVVVAMAAPAVAEPLSGRYGPLLLAFRGDMVHGVYSEARRGNGTDEAPQFSCLFLVEGRLVGQRADVQTWFPGAGERIEGTLDLGSEPSLRLNENHGGCAMTSGDMVSEPYPLGSGEPHPEWIGAGLVAAPRAILRQEPLEDPKRTRPYLVEFDAVAVTERRGNWIRVAYVEGDGAPVTGWVRGDEVTVTMAGEPGEDGPPCDC